MTRDDAVTRESRPGKDIIATHRKPKAPEGDHREEDH
jgi:hypothetical protein